MYVGREVSGKSEKVRGREEIVDKGNSPTFTFSAFVFPGAHLTRRYVKFGY